MESTERVIVIDMVGDGEDTVKTAEKSVGHECRCGACNCGKKDGGVQLELQLQSYELPSPGADRVVRRVLSGAAPQLRHGAGKPSIQ